MQPTSALFSAAPRRRLAAAFVLGSSSSSSSRPAPERGVRREDMLIRTQTRPVHNSTNGAGFVMV